MTDKPRRLLILAGTFEARQIIHNLSQHPNRYDLTASLAGTTSEFIDLEIATRRGGFGGVDGLIRYLNDHAIDLLIDATHPFAMQISTNALKAADAACIPVFPFLRPPWQQQEEDKWLMVQDLCAASNLLPDRCTPFLAIGRQHISTFYDRPDLNAVVRMIEPPPIGFPQTWTLIRQRATNRTDQEKYLLESHKITHLVTKNSGGMKAYGKIEAARALKLPVFMISRPHHPAGQGYKSVDALCDGIHAHFGF